MVLIIGAAGVFGIAGVFSIGAGDGRLANTLVLVGVIFGPFRTPEARGVAPRAALRWRLLSAYYKHDKM